MDEIIASWLHEHATPGVTTVMRVITVLGSPLFVILLTIVAVGVLMLRRYRYSAVQLGLCVASGILINTILKNVVERTRPHFEPALASAYGHSFPSGHVAAATLLYGSIIVLAWHRMAPVSARIAVASTLIILVQLISLSRMYLGVHYLTDVLAAQFLGALWITISFITVEIFRRRRLAASQSGPEAGKS
jgi:undecaprenyl-diphosphatase